MVFVLTALVSMVRLLRPAQKMSILVASLIGLGLTVPANAQAMNEAGIRSKLFGLTLEGEYQSGVAWQELFNSDGTTEYEDPSSKARGSLTFKGTQVCFSYKDNAAMSGGCFEVWQRGRHCFDFYGTDGTGRTSATQSQKLRALAWDARGWHIGADKGDCVADLIS